MTAGDISVYRAGSEIMNMSDNNQNAGPGENGRQDTGDVNLSFALTKTDLFWYNIHFARFIVWGALALFIMFAAGAVLVLKTPSGDLQTAFVWGEMAIAVGLSMCVGIIAAIALQVFFLRNETVAMSMEKRNYIINSAGITVYNDRRRITRTWRDILKIIRTRKAYYFRTGDKLAIIVPFRVFAHPDEREFFEKIVAKYA